MTTSLRIGNLLSILQIPLSLTGLVRDWQKIQPDANVYHSYRLLLQQNLSVEWELIRSCGRIGQRPTRMVIQAVISPDIAEMVAADMDRLRCRRGICR